MLNRIGFQDGFIPILYWSAESSIVSSHKSAIEDFHWLPKNVWVRNDLQFVWQNSSLAYFICYKYDRENFMKSETNQECEIVHFYSISKLQCNFDRLIYCLNLFQTIFFSFLMTVHIQNWTQKKPSDSSLLVHQKVTFW